jgi:hypothetical protein
MNPCVLIGCPLLAQIQRFDGLRERFSGPRAQFGLDDAATALAVIAALAFVLYCVNRWHSRHSGRQSFNSPKAMFRELCKAHKLDRKARQLLKQVARWQGLAHPARLFVEPERFETINLSPQLERRSAELQKLRAKLFATELASHGQDPTDHNAESQVEIAWEREVASPSSEQEDSPAPEPSGTC